MRSFSFKRILSLLFIVAAIVILMSPFQRVSATTVSVLDGQVSVTDTANSNTVSGGTVTIKATGSTFSKKTNTVTITNETANKAELSFDYSASTYNSFTIAGASVGASGSYSAVLDAGATVTLVLVSNSGLSNKTATLTLSNFSLTTVAASSNVTFEYDSAYGSITVDGNATATGAVVEISGTTGATLVATTANGGTFLGWVNTVDNKILSAEASYPLIPVQDMTVKAVFVGTNSVPHFYVGGATQKSVSSGLLDLSKIYYYQVGESYTHLFDDLNEAAAAAAASSSTSKAVVLANSGTLAAGTYTIPSGVTLLIPFDSANTMFTTQVTNTGTYTTPTAYRTLTMADGANLVVNGAVSVSAKQMYAAGSNDAIYGGAPTGNVGMIKMEGSSNITVNNGGALYVYGFIYGSGAVTAKNGSTIYEMFQFGDFRGGTQSTGMKNGVFPLSQFYIQNIEVPMTIEYGAKEYANTTIYMSSSDFLSTIAFIGSSGSMFNLTSGYLVKEYDGATDRLIIDIYGDMTVSSIDMEIGSSAINSKDYELPINGNMTISVNSGTVTVQQDMNLLPGGVINIQQNGALTVDDGYNFYVYDADQWGNFCGHLSHVIDPVAYAPGRTGTRSTALADQKDATIVVDGTLDATAGYLYTTAGGANVCSTGNGTVKITAGTQTTTYQFVQSSSTYTEIPITPAMLTNADGSFVATAAGGSNTYTYTNGKWTCATHTASSAKEENRTEATCSAAGSYDSVVYCSVCNTEISREQKTISKLAHTEVTDAAVAATCTTAGKTEGKHCSVCGTVTVAQEVVSALGHTEVVDAAVGATCTATGLTEGKHCSVCGTVTVAQEVVSALGHSYEEVVTAPTCTEKGYTTYTCTVCGDSYTAGEVAATGHSYQSVVTAPTCTAKGYTTHTCSVCGDSYVDNYTEMIDHAYVDNKCSVCGETLGTITKGRFTMELDGVIYLNYYPTLEGFSEGFDFANRGGVLVWVGSTAPTSRNELTVDNVSDTTCQMFAGMYQNSSEEWFVQSPEIVAKELDKVIYLRPYVEAGKDENGETVYIYMNVVQYYSPAQYCYDILKNPDDEADETEHVCAALLQYGAAAQTYFNAGTSLSAEKYTTILARYESVLSFNDGYLNEKTLSTEANTLFGKLQADTTILAPKDSSDNYLISMKETLSLEGAIRLSVGVSVTGIEGFSWDNVDFENSKVLFWSASDMAKSQSISYDSTDYSFSCKLTEQEAGAVDLGTYRAKSQYIVAKNLGETVYYICYLQMNDGTIYRSGLRYYSPEQYLIDQLEDTTIAADLTEVCKRIAVYGEMARIRFAETTVTGE